MVIMCLAMATPLFYSMAGGSQKAPALGLDAVALEKSMRDRIRKLVSPGTEKDTVLKWSRCLADGLVAWFDKSGCEKVADANLRDQCLSDAGMESAHNTIFQTCAKTHAPKTWGGLQGAVAADVVQFLTAQKTPAVQMKSLTTCVADKAIEAMDGTDCPPAAIFLDGGCFDFSRRVQTYAAALPICMAEFGEKPDLDLPSHE